jgi:glycosyltransferase involved in cell wall biosynthesis
MPKVTVILTSFNHEKYLRNAIDSVLDQTFADFELIIWDDASSDSSWDIITSYRDQRIRPFRNATRRRAIWGINKAITEVAKGELIAIHHSDDVWEPSKLERQVAFFDENFVTGAVFTNASTIGEDGAPLADRHHFYSRIFEQPNRSQPEWLNHLFYRGNVLCHPSALIRRECFRVCGGYRPGFGQLSDLDMWVRLCLKYPIHVLPEKLVRFRIREHEANTSGNKPEAVVGAAFEYYLVIRNYLAIDTPQTLFRVFPQMEGRFTKDPRTVEFVLAMAALEAGGNHAKLFGMELLFSILQSPEKAQAVQDLYGFDHSALVRITRRFDVFSVKRPVFYSWRVAKIIRAAVRSIRR